MEAQFYSKRNNMLFTSILFLSLTVSPLISEANKLSTKSYNAFPAVTLRDSVVKSLTVNVSCNGGATGKATVGAKNGTSPYTYSWTPNVSSTATATGLSAGTYSISVRDALGSSGTTAVVTITQPTVLRDSIATNSGVGCSGGNGGSAKVGAKGGIMPYAYLWSNGSTLATASGLSAGSYSVRVTDKNGCGNTITATITQPTVLTDNLASHTNPTCNGGFGSATINISGGTTPYTFTWTRGLSTTATATNLVAGSYTVTVKDAHSCNGTTVTFTITQPAAIRDSSVMALKTNVLCNGSSTGTATVGVKYGVAPYAYSWSPNVSSLATATGLSAGVYSVTVTDQNGCSGPMVAITITQPTAISGNITVTASPTTCSPFGGHAMSSPSGGTPTYQYLWSDAHATTTSSVSNLTIGSYALRITDRNGCSVTDSVTMAIPKNLGVSLGTIIPATCYNSVNGEASANANGGNLPYTYSWINSSSVIVSSKQNTGNILAAGTYTVVIEDNCGVSGSTTATITQPAQIRDSVTSYSNPLCYGLTGTVNVGFAGGKGPYYFTYSVNNNLTDTASSNVSINNISQDDSSQNVSNNILSIDQTYIYSNSASIVIPGGVQEYLIITDTMGCSSLPLSFILTQPDLLTDSIGAVTCTDSSITASVNAYGGTLPYTYLWSSNAGTTQTVSGIQPGMYTVTVTDAN
ncbi:MAG TPA: SprB repeat-containing protein, partial [Bacteroidia bacterium]|nr:SprB repeat-containing protein [Bacteroidia bacterium]